MSERLKRGGLFPNGLEKQEAKLLKGRPTWNQWKHVVEKGLGISFKDSYQSAESLFHQFYCMRRLHQIAGEISQEEVERFWQKAEEEMPDFERKFGEVIFFISQQIPVRSRN